MTDRVKTLTVHLCKDVRDDDVEGLVNAIRHFANVNEVETNVTTCTDHDARMRVRYELADKFRKFWKEITSSNM